MLAANECVATWLEDLGVPSLYRIHEKPEPRRVVQFEELAASFGYSLGLGALPVKRVSNARASAARCAAAGRNPRQHEVPEDIAVTPRMYQKLAAKIEGKPEERILSYLMLRSLMQARYSEINEGHFALAAPTYTHFTSPIRRYPDLIVHRITKALLRAGIHGHGEIAAGRLSSPWTHPHEAGEPHNSACPTLGAAVIAPKVGGIPEGPKYLGFQLSRKSAAHTIDPPIPEAELAQIAEETSQTERRAAEAERELVEWKKVRFMQDRVGEEFDALVLNPAKYGLFVELTDLFVEGLVPIDYSARRPLHLARKHARNHRRALGTPLPRRRPRPGDPRPHPRPGTQIAVLPGRRRHSPHRQEVPATEEIEKETRRSGGSEHRRRSQKQKQEAGQTKQAPLISQLTPVPHPCAFFLAQGWETTHLNSAT